MTIQPRFKGDTMLVVKCDEPGCTTPPFGPFFGKSKIKKFAERAGWHNGDGVKWRCAADHAPSAEKSE